MKDSIRNLAAGLAALLVLGMAACGGPGGDSAADSSDPDTAGKAPVLTEYTAPGGTFAVSVPEIEGGWTESDGSNDYHLVLDNSDMTFSILIQALPLEQAQTVIGEFEEFVDYYRDSTLSVFGEPESVDMTIGEPAIEGVVTDFYTAEQDGVTAKALVSFFQTDAAYYVCILTGEGDAYDTNIDAVKAAMTTFTEKTGEQNAE